MKQAELARMNEADFLAVLAGDRPLSRLIDLRHQRKRVFADASLVFAFCAVALASLAGWVAGGAIGFAFAAPWLLLTGAAHWLSLQRARRDRHHQERRPMPATAAEGAGLGLLWSSLPAWALASGAPALPLGLTVAAAIMAGTLASAEPAFALSWIAVLFASQSWGLWSASGGDLILMMALTGNVAVAGLGVLLVQHWVRQQGKDAQRIADECETVGLLLREYEQRGAGWLWQVDSGNRILYLSRRITNLLGRAPAQVIGQPLPAVLGGGGALGQALLARTAFSALEMEIRTNQGDRWISLTGDPIVDGDGLFQGFRGVGADVTEARRTKERLTNLANMDVLSGLPNRSRVRELLGDALAAAQGSGIPCAVLFLDLDGFKPVNDTFGHMTGDTVLKSVAQRLVREVGGMGEVGRIGGDEFAVVVPDAQSRARVDALGARLIAAVSEPYQADSAKIRIGLSIGCAFGPVDGQSVDDLIQKADMALYQAKARGRGMCCAFDASMQKEAEQRLRLEEDLRHALPGNQFRLTYQPLVRASDQRLVGFEALIRWHHPVRGLISPLDFIPLAEETGIITHLGDWVIEEACRAAAHWPDHISVAVNLSPRQLVLPALPNAVSESLTRHRIKPNRLELEVTESVFLGDTHGALDVLRRLRQLGVGIALDDFGTGYSSLGYLNKTVFHKLKIDGSFVREAAKNKETVAIIQSIVTLANSFRMTITAEGVETMADFERMRDMGCHQIQGYLFGRPMDFDKATELVRGGGNARMSA
ncbi:EAL domain-containing protein [Allosphingosinicella flava]|uniref:EAL domain-containing protein n=1 Tax=Allosphingosinicella flava TaxID=2771430 RepID=A0A7T2GHZ1_9SPHN|nr:EAL domain-containing protein [Sphingosinicella flava]QPQ54222.1 EAL domain-containing protein [Sphingosinicella flava]